jgi:hypothetical protein
LIRINFIKKDTIFPILLILILTIVISSNTSQIATAQLSSVIPKAQNISVEEGGSTGNVTLDAPQSRSFAASPTPVPFSEEEIEELERRTEKTLNRPQIGVINETAAPPPNGTAVQLANQTDVIITNQTSNSTQAATITPTSSLSSIPQGVADERLNFLLIQQSLHQHHVA